MRHEIIIENIILDHDYYYLVLPVWHCMEGVHKRLGLYKVLTHGQGNLEAKGEPRTTNMGQIMHRKTYSKAGLQPQATWRPARYHTWRSSLERPSKGQILTVLLLSSCFTSLALEDVHMMLPESHSCGIG